MTYAAKTLRAWMKKNKLSYRAAAARVGVSKDTLCAVANGTARLLPETAFAIARAIGVNDWWNLIGRKGKRHA